jgi:hypothetical protein
LFLSFLCNGSFLSFVSKIKIKIIGVCKLANNQFEALCAVLLGDRRMMGRELGCEVEWVASHTVIRKMVDCFHPHQMEGEQ